MNLDTRAAGAGADVMSVRVDGEIDMVTAPRLASALHDAMESGGIRRILVDFGGVTFCDSSGIAALDEAWAVAAERGIRLTLTNLRSGVRRILALSGMLDAFTEASTGDDAG